MDAGFDYRWQRHPEAQATVESAFWPKVGWAPEELHGKRVLDAGCGVGRFSALALANRAEVIGIDSSTAAVDAARVNVPGARFENADLLAPDTFAHLGTFDRIFSIGVLHHTADPEAAFHNLARMLRPGGSIAIWVYPPNPPDLAPVIEFLHAITSACPPEALYDACERYARAIRAIYHDGPMPAGWQALASVFCVSSSKDDAECVSDTYDWHCPAFRSGHTIAELRTWFERAELVPDWTSPYPWGAGLRGHRVG
jgi:SAM-dependent methyltransferase